MAAVRLRVRTVHRHTPSVLSGATGSAPSRVRSRQARVGRVGSGLRHVGSHPVVIACVCHVCHPGADHTAAAPRGHLPATALCDRVVRTRAQEFTQGPCAP